MKSRMKESQRKGVANHPDLESWVDWLRGWAPSVDRGTGGQGKAILDTHRSLHLRWVSTFLERCFRSGGLRDLHLKAFSQRRGYFFRGGELYVCGVVFYP